MRLTNAMRHLRCAGLVPGFRVPAACTNVANTCWTDPQVLKLSCLVRLEAFSIRCGCGADGQWRAVMALADAFAFSRR
jgi:N-methylhydantoinase B/oxoprolinase/acetone carboxylase alpha subunit